MAKRLNAYRLWGQFRLFFVAFLGLFVPIKGNLKAVECSNILDNTVVQFEKHTLVFEHDNTLKHKVITIKK